MASFLARDTLLLHTAVAHGRLMVAEYLVPDGIPAERCLDNLLALMFHPALDAPAVAAPAEPKLPVEILQRAVADSRGALLQHFGPEASTSGPDCLDAMIGILDDPAVTDAGGFEPILTVKTGRLQSHTEVPHGSAGPTSSVRRLH